MAYIKEYWKNKEQRAETARKHTKEMQNKYGRCIQTSILGTKIYDTNSFNRDFEEDIEDKDTKIIVENILEKDIRSYGGTLNSVITICTTVKTKYTRSIKRLERIMKCKNYIINTFRHFKKVCTHKRWVFYYCCKVGIPFQGLVHDLSKFSPTEFWESVKYYQGTSSPIDACKKENGWSAAWMHHKGRNKHHYEYWQDNFDNGGNPIEMPMKYKKEMLCDYLGAGRAYHGKSFNFEKELKWWKSKKSKPIAMHPNDIAFIDKYINLFYEYENREYDIRTIFNQIKKEGK